jgi:hypothetical protein
VNLLRRTPLVAAYVCARGAFVIIGKRSLAGVEIDRVLEVPAALETELAAAEHLVSVLRSALVTRAAVALSLRGFGVVHHVLQLPPGKDDVLGPIIEREVRRLEPQLGDSVIGWTPLPTLDAGVTETVPQRSVLAAAAPRQIVSTVERQLREAGYHVTHITALPAAMQRLLEEFDEGSSSVAMVAPLPDGAFLGFSLKGGLRIVVEPPLPKGTEHESAALAEEVELGAMFVRQQFRGAQLERIALVGTKEGLEDAENAIADRLRLPTRNLGVRGLSPAAFAALGALLDQQSSRPLSLGGETRRRAAARAAGALQTAAMAALIVFALAGAWTVTETVRTVRASSALETARHRIQQDSFGLVPIRQTAQQRRLVRDAVAAARVVATDRIQLQESLAGIAAAVRIPVRLDSMSLVRQPRGWNATLRGTAPGLTSAEAIQYLHDAYRELPQRLSVDSLRLEELSYSDTEGRGRVALVRFQFSFVIPSARGQ